MNKLSKNLMFLGATLFWIDATRNGNIVGMLSASCFMWGIILGEEK